MQKLDSTDTAPTQRTENPRVAVLEPGLEGRKGKYAIAGIVGAVFTVIGAGMWYLTPIVARWMS